MTSESPSLAELAARVARLEALDEIRQLAAKYTVALDMRDMNSMANLFVADVRVPGRRTGRAALRAWYDWLTVPAVGGDRTEVLDAARAFADEFIDAESALAQ